MINEKAADDCRQTGRRGLFWSFGIYFFAFAVPFLLLLAAFASVGVYPFGDRQVLVIDAWNQYYPFLTELRRKLRAGESLLYSWRLGLGSGFTAVIAYYLASPLNLLFVVFPEALLREAFTLILLIKTGFAGSFCAYSLHKRDGKNEYGVIVFSTFYALCGWVLGYYWNIMWLDTFAVFPLVVLGTDLLIKEKKYRLYTVSLACAVITNYYIGMMVCMFTAVYFFVQCYILKNSRRQLWENLKRILVCSALSVLMSAAVILPSLAALQNTYQQGWSLDWSADGDWAGLLANFLAYGKPVYREGLANIYSGVICLLLLFVFCSLQQVSVREKTGTVFLLLFLYCSMNIHILNDIWHGLHIPNQLPFRYSFLLSFLVVRAAYRAYGFMMASAGWSFRFVCAASAVFFLLAAAVQVKKYADGTGVMDFNELWLFLLKNSMIITAYLGIFYLIAQHKAGRKAVMLLLALAAGLEIVPTVLTAVRTVGTTDRTGYPDQYGRVQEVLDSLADENTGDDFYRTEFCEYYTLNTPVLYGYQGITAFSSTVNTGVVKVLNAMGIPAKAVDARYCFQNSTPVNHAFLNLKYLISRGQTIVNQEYFTEAAKAGSVCAYKNEAYLPVGFMTDEAMADFSFDAGTPFENQNQLVKAAAGIEENVFEPLDIVHVGHENVTVTRLDYGTYRYGMSDDADHSENEKFKFSYALPKDACVYAYMDFDVGGGISKKARVGIDEDTRSYQINYACIFPAGTYEEGEVFSVSAEAEAGRSGDLHIYVSMLNQEVFDRAYDILKDEALQVTACTSNSLKGTITAKKDGLMYTSVPYEPGWQVSVDGKKADVTLAGGVFMAVSLPGGEHTVEFRYVPVYVYAAVWLSFAGAGMFVCICVHDRKKHGRRAGI